MKPYCKRATFSRQAEDASLLPFATIQFVERVRIGWSGAYAAYGPRLVTA